MQKISSKRLLLSLLLLSLFFSPMISSEQIKQFEEREIMIPMGVTESYDKQIIHRNDISIVFPESLMKTGVATIVRVEYWLDGNNMLEKIKRMTTYKFYNFNASREASLYQTVPPFKIKESGAEDVEREVHKALSTKGFQAEKKIEKTRTEVSDFYFNKNNVYARAFVRTDKRLLLASAREIFESSDLGIEYTDDEHSIIQSKTRSGEKGTRKFDFFIILKNGNSNLQQKMESRLKLSGQFPLSST